MTVHSIHVHNRPEPEQVDSFAGLQAWLDKRLDSIEQDLADEETAQAMGRQLRERRTTLLDVAFVIRAAVEEEAADKAADAEYDRWKEAYGADADKLGAYQAEGR